MTHTTSLNNGDAERAAQSRAQSDTTGENHG
jgi:hypothetical protein